MAALISGGGYAEIAIAPSALAVGTGEADLRTAAAAGWTAAEYELADIASAVVDLSAGGHRGKSIVRIA